jgi:hypothetical protein
MVMKLPSFAAAILFFSAFGGTTDAAGNHTLPVATYNGSAWFVTVPEIWNFSTILNVTGRSSTIDPNTLPVPYPGFDPQPPPVYVNGSWSGYATNAESYGYLYARNASIAPYSDETWVLPVVCEWPIGVLQYLKPAFQTLTY